MTDDATLRKILESTKAIAMVGASPKPERPSHEVMHYLQQHGYRVLPVNPSAAASGAKILGEKAYAAIAEIPGQVDVVDVFRASEAVPSVVDEVLAVAAEKGVSTLWLQLGVVHQEAAKQAQAAGLQVVMDRCIKQEHQRLVG